MLIRLILALCLVSVMTATAQATVSCALPAAKTSTNTEVKPPLLPTAETPAAKEDYKNSFDCLPPEVHPAYVGVSLGYGNTNWQQMISQDEITSTSTPVTGKGSGVAAGIVAGYELSSHFAVEANYARFPTSHLTFELPNVYNIESLTSRTNAYNIVAKFMVPVGSPKFKAFSEIGPAYVQRDDDMTNKGRIGGVFGVGVDYNINPRWLIELGFQYYTGYGESELKPVYDYIPFLYTLNMRLAYRFSVF